MKVLKGIATVLILTVLCAALALTLAAGLVRFVALNPSFITTFMPTDSYCAELRSRISDDLDHIALQAGFEEGRLGKLVTNKAIRAYTDEVIDTLYAHKDGTVMKMPVYPTDAFEQFAKDHTDFSEQGRKQFAEDCATAVEEDIAAFGNETLVDLFTSFRNNRIVKWSLVLFIAGLMLSVLMIVFLRLLFLGEARRAGSVIIWGGLFMGVTVVFVPVMQFLLFDYIGRLKISVSAFRTVLTGYLSTILYGWFFVLLALEILTILGSVIAVILACRKRK